MERGSNSKEKELISEILSSSIKNWSGTYVTTQMFDPKTFSHHTLSHAEQNNEIDGMSEKEYGEYPHIRMFSPLEKSLSDVDFE